MKRTPLLVAVVAVVGLGQLVLDPPRRAFSRQVSAQSTSNTIVDLASYQDLRWRSVGPHRGGRSTAVAGVRSQPNVFYMGATGGGVFKTENYGITWTPVRDGQIAARSI